ncbi:MAG: S-layer homology domain-containing protein, partial [Bacillota bacterium]
KAALEQAAVGTNALTLSTPVASLSFDTAALSSIFGESAGDVKITTAKVDASTLTDATKELVGDRPVFNFSVTSGNDTISEFGGNVTVSVPYTPKDGEDTDAIVIYYINSEGKPEAVANCKYNPVTKTVTFTTDHFSQYAVGYNKVEFSDIKAGAWYQNAVEFAAARGIVTGTGNGNYSPDGKLTRGQLLVMLMRAYGIEPDANPSSNFSDAGNTYYTGYLAAAKRLGITEGLGNNLYAPDKQITRQEMFTLLYNTLKVIGELPEGAEKADGSIAGYSDTDTVASWAKEAVGQLTASGTISGSNGKLSPGSTTTRAEMAQVIYNLLSK